MTHDTLEGYRASVQQLEWAARPEALALLRMDLPASIEASRLKQALQAAVHRHEILRTRLRTVPGLEQPLQVIAGDDRMLDWVIDAHGDAPAMVDGRERALLAQIAERFKDPAQPPLASALIRRTAAPSRWLLALPAANADRSSLCLLAHELARALQGPAPDDEPLQYADFAEWQHELQQGDAGAAGRVFWQRQLDPAALQGRHPFERRSVHEGRVLRDRLLDRTQADRLMTAAGGLKASVPELLFVAWSALLQRQLGTPALVVAWQHDGRNELTRSALGAFAKRLPLRITHPPGQTLAAAVREQQALLAEAQTMHDAFDSARPDAAPWPFGFQFDDELAWPPSWAPLEARSPVEPTSLSLQVAAAHGGTWRLALDADARRFAPEALELLLDQLATQLTAACEQPQSPLEAISPLSDTQRRHLHALHRPTASIASPALLHQLFEQQVRQRPQAVALEFDAQQLRYRELNERSNRIAHRLRREGLQPEQVVGLFAGRSIEALVGMLGILKAGGAYLPLDPAYPRERIAHMLQDSAAALVLAAPDQIGALPSSQAQVLLLDDTLADEPGDDPAPVNHPDQLAYLIYTSGSTGRPKGVMVSHRNAVHSTTVRWQAYEAPCESFLLLSSVSFDSSVAGLFWTLSEGGRLVLPDDTQVLDLQALGALIESHRVSHTLMLPSLYAQLLEAEASRGRTPARLASLRCVIVAGEAAPAALSARHRSACPQARLYNEYGPTEGSVWCTLYRSDGSEAGAVLAIGAAIPNMQVHVLDAGFREQAAGMAGEIVIGGAGVVRGYLRRAGLTAERFVPDPFGAPGSRVYRTGDLGRFGADGVLEFIGRIDHQVKIRGHRIELGEIEAALAAHPEVREAAVLARREPGDDGSPGEARLVAYVVPRGRAQPQAWREHLKQRLPEHMLPSAFVVLDGLPLTPNGKVDRAALPEPVEAERRPYVEPRNEAEALLAQLWAEVLRVQRVGRDDDFFELGGHSLVATQLVSRVRAALGREVAVRAVFQHPRLVDFASHVLGSAGSTLPAPVPVPREGPLPLSFAQQRLWCFDRLYPGHAAYNVADAVRLRGPLDLPALQRSFDALAARHESLRTRFEMHSGEPAQVIDPPRPVPLPVIDLSGVEEGRREAEARRLLEAEATAPFDLAHGPLLRTGLVRLGDDEHVLWLTLHHIVSDGWSMRVLVRELTQFYEAFCEGRDPDLPPLRLQVADHAAWQRSPALAAVLQDQLAFWREHLGSEHRPLRLPGMRERPALQSHRGDHLVVNIDAALTARIDALCAERGVTRFMLLLAVFKALLATAGDARDLRVGVPIANRHRLELEGLVGFFVNWLALRTVVDLEGRFDTLLGQVRETLLAAHAHQDLPFEQLVEALQPQRDPGCSPLFQAMFDLHRGRVLSQDRIGRLAVERMPGRSTHTTMFDLMLDITEGEQGLEAIFTYSTDLFEPDAVKRLAQAYVALVGAALDAPDAPLASLVQPTQHLPT